MPKLSNNEIVVLAVFLLGGEAQAVDTEDIAVKASELAPGRFSWRKYPDRINLELVRVYLSDAKKPRKGAYLLGSGREGWLLSDKGHEFAQARSGDLARAQLARVAQSPQERQWMRAERARLLATDAFTKYQTDGGSAVLRQDAEAFFRVDAYVQGQARERKIIRILNAFRDDSELGPVARALANKLREG